MIADYSSIFGGFFASQEDDVGETEFVYWELDLSDVRLNGNSLHDPRIPIMEKALAFATSRH